LIAPLLLTEEWVLGPGIEPGTRGFSMRASKDVNKAKVLRFLKVGFSS
jgi:hypothetical protein